MSEKVDALLLRLYPSEFREAYGREALQLIRDRWRDERGIALRLRLCLDLTADLLVTALRSCRYAKPLVAASDSRVGAPSFQVLEFAGPEPKAFIAGILLSVAVMAAAMRMIHPLGHDDGLTQRRTLAGLRSGFPQSNRQEPQASDAVDAALGHKIIETVAGHLRQHYRDPVIGRQLADAVLAHDRNGDYASATTGADFASRITAHIRAISREIGLPVGEFVAEVIYSRRVLPTGPPPPPTPEGQNQYRTAVLQQNCLFETFETLPHNIGYLKLNGFPDASICQAMTKAAMASANNVQALILDLRDNSGGFGNTAMQIAAYLFDHPEYLYDPREVTSPRAWTASPVPDSRLADTPVYILTSSRTLSAAEYFTYNLKMLKRATIVGETTGGAQHSGVFHGIADHFGVAIQQVVSINPFAVKGWESIGVEPDVKVPRSEALEAAKKLAESRSRGR